jgi:uncharacterized protein
VKQKHLKESLEGVINSCVNTVGVDLNTASVPLLRHVSGLNQLVAREVVTFRERNGKFTNREQLHQVAGLGDKRFVQAAGFLKLPDGTEPLDSTWIHPESYSIARQILTELGFAPTDLQDRAKLEELQRKLGGVNVSELATRMNAGEMTVRDILNSLAKPGRDPREDLPPPIFKKGVLKLEDITAGMELKGTVLNVVPFGAFVDIGLKESGLVHISQMANRYIKSPYDVVSVGDVVAVWVMEVKAGEKKISLSMIPPGQERRAVGGGGRFGGPPRGSAPVGAEPAQASPVPRQQPQPGAERPAFQPRGERPPFTPRGDRPGFQPRGGARPGRGPGPGGPSAPGAHGPGGPRPVGAPPQQTPGGGTAPPQGTGSIQPPPPVQPPPPPRRPPAKPKPLPNLSAEKKSGKAALNTFAELAAFFKKEEPKPEPKAEEPKPEPVSKAQPNPTEPQAETDTKSQAPAEESKSEPEVKIQPAAEEQKPDGEQTTT